MSRELPLPHNFSPKAGSETAPPPNLGAVPGSADPNAVERLFSAPPLSAGRSDMPLDALPEQGLATRLLRRGWRLIRALHPSRLARRRAVRRILASGLFDPGWYRRHHPDVVEAGLDPAQHFLDHGRVEKRDPGPAFSTVHYLDLFPDLSEAQNPLLHFLDRVARLGPVPPAGLTGAIETLPDTVYLGEGAVLFVKGWCYAPGARIAALDLRIGATRWTIADRSQPRPDVFERELPRGVGLEALDSGFAVTVALPATMPVGEVEVALIATLDGGRGLEKICGRLRLRDGTGAEPRPVVWPASGAKVAIAMATFEPPLDLFAAQIASIKAQSHANWLCILSDDGSSERSRAAMARLIEGDSRFLLLPPGPRLGFYRNFERALLATPADADFVALSDQDDRWYADKLASLLERFRPDTHLVYADVRIVGDDGSRRSDTFWVTRSNNYTSLAALLAANTVIGAAAMFRAGLLADILPFPERLGDAYHDHWIGLNALTKGDIAYVDRPLHDYVQHGANVIGHKHDRDAPGIGEAATHLAAALRQRSGFGVRLRQILEQASLDRYGLVAQKILLAETLLLRHPGAARRKRLTLARFSRLDRFRIALRERIAAAIERRPTLNYEGLFLRAVVGEAARRLYYRSRRGRIARWAVMERHRRAAKNFFDRNDRDASISFAVPPPGRIVPALQFGDMAWLVNNIAPLRLDIDPTEPRRVELLLATINFDYLFGGYIGMFNLALRLRRQNHRVRIVLLERTDVDLPTWRAKIQKYPGLGQLFDLVEIEYRFDRRIPLTVNPADRFVATNGWSAHVAHRAILDLGGRPFVFMVQEFEPFFGPMNSHTALLRQAYDFPQFALFSTDLLRDFFAENRIGVFERPDGETRSALFRNAIQPFAPSRRSLTRRSRRLLFYARPEAHAARNLFELGLVALVELFRDGEAARLGWSAHGIGSIKGDVRLDLGGGVLLDMMPKTSLQDYAAMLPSFDVGLSLMLTPHPSLVPLEMASAGLLTVTNTFANKTAERLAAISSNLIGVTPTLEGIVGGLRLAMSRIEDVDARLAGAKVDWPHDWNSAFPPETIAKLDEWLAS